MIWINKSFNHYIPILVAIAIIGILFVPAVSAGKIINFGPIQGTVKTIPAVKYNPASFQPIIPEGAPDPLNQFYDPASITQNSDFSRLEHLPIPKDYAIRIAVESIGNTLILTSDPIASLTTQNQVNIATGSKIKKTVWVVELSGTPTDPNAWIGNRRYIDSRTGEIAHPPTHVDISVMIDARTGKIISSTPFFSNS